MMMFEDREDAGKKLADELIKQKVKADLILAIPRGGVPVAFQVAKALKTTLDVIIPRKLPVPYDPEAGFGAVIDGEVSLNYEMIKRLKISKAKINAVINEVRAEIKRRMAVYRSKKPLPVIKRKTIIIVDDGLASGYTMLAAIEHLKKKKAKVIVAVPVSSSSAFDLVRKKARLVCLHISTAYIFAVAGFYKVWADLTDEEVIGYLKKF